MNIEIKKATTADIPLIRKLSETIWKDHYTSIISLEQIEYMLDKMYSPEKLREEINNPGYEYHLAMLDGKPAGYIAISSESGVNFMLNKFYILNEHRFKGFGELVFNLVFKGKEFRKIELFVNRQNFKSINFYFKMGFKIAGVVDNHFGNGYYMNDFIMVKSAI